MIQTILTRLLILITMVNTGLCNETLVTKQQELINRNWQARLKTTQIYKSTEQLSKFATAGEHTLGSLAQKAKDLGIYSSASMYFGEWLTNQIYDTPLPFDLDKDHRYCIITFREQGGERFQVSILLKLKWSEHYDKDRDTRADDMLRITTDFYTHESIRIECVRCWFNPWGANGKLFAADERKKSQKPITYWTTAVGRKSDSMHKKYLKNKMENRVGGRF